MEDFVYDMIFLEDSDDTFMIYFSSETAPDNDNIKNIMSTMFSYDMDDWNFCGCEGCARDREENKEMHFTSDWLPCSQKGQLLNLLEILGFKILSLKYNFYETIEKHFVNNEGYFDRSLGVFSYTHAVGIIFRIGVEGFFEKFGIPEESFQGMVKVNV